MKTNSLSGIWWGLSLTVLLLVLILWVYHPLKPQTSGNAIVEDALGIQNTSGPWVADSLHLKARLDSIGLPALSSEGTALHIHQHIDIFINGIAVAVPSQIGVNESLGFISPIHTHDDEGIIHVESPTVQEFNLGQFFDIWGVKFTDGCIGSYCNNATSTMKIYLNGKLYSGDPRKVPLTAHEEIALIFGTVEQMPKDIPEAYLFPDGD